MDEKRSLADANSGLQPEKAETPKQQDTVIPTPTAADSQYTSVNEKKDEKTSAKGPIADQSLQKSSTKRRRFHFYHIKNVIKKAHPLNIKAKLEHYKFEYSRILHLARKPTKQEFKELSIMVIVGTFIIGILGFIIQMIIQFM